MTKKEVIALFQEEVRPSIPRGDTPALLEAWNNYTDSLAKDKRITMKQYEQWTNPFDKR